jgi:hypothetical protein
MPDTVVKLAITIIHSRLALDTCSKAFYTRYKALGICNTESLGAPGLEEEALPLKLLWETGLYYPTRLISRKLFWYAVHICENVLRAWSWIVVLTAVLKLPSVGSLTCEANFQQRTFMTCFRETLLNKLRGWLITY